MAWERLGSASGGSSSISVTITAKEYLRVIFQQNTAVQCKIQFNDDANQKYCLRRSENSGSDASETDQTYMRNWNSGGATQRMVNMDIVNLSGEEKICNIETAENTSGASGIPNRMESVGKYTEKTGQITKVSFVALSGTIDSDATLTVFGASSTTVEDEKDSLTNIPVGTQYRETDTRKIYRRKGAISVSDADQNFDFSSQGSWDLNIEGSSSHWDLDNNRLNFETKGASSGSGAHFDLTSVPDKWILRFKFRIDSSQSGYTSAGQGDGLICVGLQSHDTESANTASSPNTSNQQDYSEAHDQAQLVVLFKTAESEGSGKYSFQAKFINDDEFKQESQHMNNNDILDDTDYYVEIKQTGATSFELSYGTNSDYSTGRTTATVTGVTLSNLRYIHVEGCAQNVTYDSYGGGYIDDMQYYSGVSTLDPSWVERGTA